MADQLVEIEDSDELYRRVFHYYIVQDRATLRERVSSATFKDKRTPKEISVSCARLTTPAECLARGEPGQKLVGLRASTPRRLDLRVLHAPTDDDYSHCNIEGEITKAKRDQLAAESWPVAVP